MTSGSVRAAEGATIEWELGVLEDCSGAPEVGEAQKDLRKLLQPRPPLTGLRAFFTKATGNRAAIPR